MRKWGRGRSCLLLQLRLEPPGEHENPAVPACPSAQPWQLLDQVLNVAARQRWLARCPSFVDEAQAVQALELGPYLGYQVTRGLVPLAMCTHPLLYMAVVPSLGCPGCGAGPSLRDRKPGQDLPLRVPASPEAQLSP
ncbi:P2Y purinoceptor 11 [Thomomys bottae]